MSAITQAELAEARRLQNLTLLDQLTLHRPGPAQQGRFANTPSARQIYQGPGRIVRGDRTTAKIVTPGQEPVQVATWVAAIPWDAPAPEPGDTLTVTSSIDPTLADRTWRVVDVEASTLVTVRRFRCTQERHA